ncbi:dUTP diphosphatase [Peribacillus muralis]|uniref:dUTP diphosphatase n=1 Tax=Peribacillus muralis TaxID=264697 RepID=UPI003D05A2D2
MNLNKLFETQKVLRDRINYNEPDRFDKLILALLVEIGECANEWRGFKFWSTDQEPRTEELIECEGCGGSGRNHSGYCGSCHGGYVGYKNPLLEEFVDGLHFILELGIELDFENEDWVYVPWKNETITEQFMSLHLTAGEMYCDKHNGCVPDLISYYIGLGEMLGFTWEQIEQAYFEKNKINHQRQSEGY